MQTPCDLQPALYHFEPVQVGVNFVGGKRALLCVPTHTPPSVRRANPSHLTRRICRLRLNCFRLLCQIKYRGIHVYNLTMFTACVECGPCEPKLLAAACSLETFGEAQDSAGHHAHRCCAATPAGLDGRGVRADPYERTNAAAIQTLQVSL